MRKQYFEQIAIGQLFMSCGGTYMKCSNTTAISMDMQNEWPECNVLKRSYFLPNSPVELGPTIGDLANLLPKRKTKHKKALRFRELENGQNFMWIRNNYTKTGRFGAVDHQNSIPGFFSADTLVIVEVEE